MKFRAWNGDYFEYANFNFKTGCLGCNFSAYVEIDTPNQSSGQLDKNGNDIYEGDILKADGDVFEGEVIFDQTASVWSCYVYRNKKKVELMTLVRFMRQRARAVSSTPEIVGNIYETPELITQK